MSPSAADVSATSAVDSLAVTAAAAKRVDAGFKEHFERANQAARTPQFHDHDPPPRPARQDSKRTDSADDQNRPPRSAGGAAKSGSKSTSKSKPSEAPKADDGTPAAQADSPAKTDDQAPADQPSNSAAEQAAGQAQADSTAKPVEADATQKAAAVVEVEQAVDATAGPGSQPATAQTAQPQTTQTAATAVDPTTAAAVKDSQAAQADATTVVAPTAVKAEPVVDKVVEKAKVELQAQAGVSAEPSAAKSAPATVAATTAAATPQAVADPQADQPDVEKDKKDSAAADLKVADASTIAATAATAATSSTAAAGAIAVDPSAALRPDAPKDDSQKSDDKSKEIAPAAADSKPTGQDATRIDQPVRTPAASGPTMRSQPLGGEGTSNLSQVERTRLVQRVAKAVQTAHDRGGELKLRLSPPELGSIKLEVRLHDGVMSARIETETRDAQQTLNENLLVLRERLSEQNIKVERFDVDVFNPGAGGGGNSADLARQWADGRDGGGQAGSRGGRAPGAVGGSGGEAAAIDVRRPAVSTDGGLNVLV